jgi:hypothetical protein
VLTVHHHIIRLLVMSWQVIYIVSREGCWRASSSGWPWQVGICDVLIVGWVVGGWVDVFNLLLLWVTLRALVRSLH